MLREVIIILIFDLVIFEAELTNAFPAIHLFVNKFEKTNLCIIEKRIKEKEKNKSGII